MGRDIVEIMEVCPRGVLVVSGYRYHGNCPANKIGAILTDEELEAEGIYDAQELEAPEDAGDPPTAAELLAEERSRALEETGADDPTLELVQSPAPETAEDRLPEPPESAPGLSRSPNVEVTAPAVQNTQGAVSNPTSAGHAALSNSPARTPGRAGVSVSEPATRTDGDGAATTAPAVERD